MVWRASILPLAEADLDRLAGGDRKLREGLEDGILDEFEGMKGDRVTKLFVQGVSTPRVDRLSGSGFPGSIRLQILTEYRATALCLPQYRQAYVTHVFHKGQDPGYKSALHVHDRRVAEFVDTFTSFVNKRRRG